MCGAFLVASVLYWGSAILYFYGGETAVLWAWLLFLVALLARCGCLVWRLWGQLGVAQEMIRVLRDHVDHLEAHLSHLEAHLA